MENTSVSIQNQSVVFDAGMEKGRPVAAAPPRRKSAPEVASRKLFDFLPGRATAAGASLLLHAVFAMLLFLFASQALPLAVAERPQVVNVTWVDLPRLSAQDDRPAVVSEPVPLPVPAQTLHKFPKEQTRLDHQANASTTADRKRQFGEKQGDEDVAVPAAVAPLTAAQKSGIEDADTPAFGQSAKASTDENLAVAASMAKPRYRENTPPQYPLSARLKGQEGIVILHAEILAEGRVGDLKVKSSSGYRILDQSALAAVKLWKFDPATKKGKPVPVWAEIPVRFVQKAADESGMTRRRIY